MPPKLFKIKKVEKKEGDSEDLLLSDFHIQRMQQQASTRDRDIKKHEEQGSADVPGIKKEIQEPTNLRRLNIVNRTGQTSGGSWFGASDSRSSAPLGLAEDLPRNTMNALMCGGETAEGVYPPVRLGDFSAASEVDRLGSGAQGSTPVTKDGTAFLKEAGEELKRGHAANTRFFNDAGGTDAKGELLFVQLPRGVPEFNQAFSLDQMPPGRIGEMLVYKSGRTELVVGNTVCDMVFEPGPQHGPHSGKGDPEGAIAQYAVAIDSPLVNDRCCYQLGWVPRKVVCTPTLDEL
eukprot:Tbor_TRINITY_DN2420_c0_g1::TRINITY_DN2420_c0_g1_i1::g.2534::m.2534/K03026/RPC4, POLR3D; DNA-directed RNA polymerase III subunit RPC4